MDISQKKSEIEALLFISERALSLTEIAKILKLENKQAKDLLSELANEYESQKKAWRLASLSSKYQLVSAPEHSKLISEFWQLEKRSELSGPSLETLSIIAYQGPISKSDLDYIRGVNCSLILRNLLIKGLIVENFDKSSEEAYYELSLDFLNLLGIDSLEKLANYKEHNNSDEIKEFLASKSKEKDA